MPQARRRHFFEALAKRLLLPGAQVKELAESRDRSWRSVTFEVHYLCGSGERWTTCSWMALSHRRHCHSALVLSQRRRVPPVDGFPRRGGRLRPRAPRGHATSHRRHRRRMAPRPRRGRRRGPQRDQLDRSTWLPSRMGGAKPLWLPDYEGLLDCGREAICAPIDDLHRRIEAERVALESRRAELELVNERWHRMLLERPLLCEVRDPSGIVVESNCRDRELSEHAWTARLEDGQVVRLERPVERGSYLQLQNLMRLENAILTRALERDNAGIAQLPLRRSLESLERWHLGQQGDDLDPDLLWRDARVPVRVRGSMEWSRLDGLTRRALLGTLREALNNCHKHNQAAVNVVLSQHESDGTTPSTFCIELAQAAPNGDTSASASRKTFGLASMRFRLSQVGGSLSIRVNEKSFRLQIRVPMRADP